MMTECPSLYLFIKNLSLTYIDRMFAFWNLNDNKYSDICIWIELTDEFHPLWISS